MEGDAFLFVAPEEESSVTRIERAIGKRIPRVTVPDFDYRKRATEKLEVPLHQRRAEMRPFGRSGRPGGARHSRVPRAARQSRRSPAF
jgi:ATP-dependent RNA helicase RhlE